MGRLDEYEGSIRQWPVLPSIIYDLQVELSKKYAVRTTLMT